MTIEEYIKKLRKELKGFDKDEAENVLAYYRELLEDAENPNEQMESLGTPAELARRIVEENECFDKKDKPKSSSLVGRIIALVLTSPFWITAYAIILTLFVCFFGVILCFPLATVFCLVGAVSLLFEYIPFAIAFFSLGFLALGVTILLPKYVMMIISRLIKFTLWLTELLFKKPEIKEKERKRFKLPIMLIITGFAALGLGIVFTVITFIIKPNKDNYAQKLGLENITGEFSKEVDSISIAADSNAAFNIEMTDDSFASISGKNVNSDSLSIENSDEISIKYTDDSDASNWFIKHFNLGGISYPEAEFTLYLPKKEYESLSVTFVNGCLNLDELEILSLDIDCNVAEVEVKNSEIDAFNADIDLGNLTLENSSVLSDFNVAIKCGDVMMTNVSAYEPELNLALGDTIINDSNFNCLNVYNECGDFEAENVEVDGILTAQLELGDANLTLMTAEALELEIECGDIYFEGLLDGSQESLITNQMGDIQLKLKGNNYTLYTDTKLGEVGVNGGSMAELNLSGDVIVRAYNSCGNIQIQTD
ncbi:MAG: DUF4097 family beta strand repeat-containing protein [Ruminococcus sp.]|nr:DUF4097 family beta strand repeat-containing protein [Ruminococcus sp.]